MYRIIKFILFLLKPETAHHLTTWFLKIPLFSKIFKIFYGLNDARLEKKLFGLTFKNPIGIAAGFDKNAEYINGLDDVGFGFIEIGTITPKGQPGNPKPRLFRLKKDNAILNRMGFNNHGVDAAIENIKKARPNILIGGNIGKNKITPNEEATNDYIQCFKALYDYVDYFVVNISSPNTPNLRALQDREPLEELLSSMNKLNKTYKAPKPILLKIAPDLSDNQLSEIVDIVQSNDIDGIIATNTTINRKLKHTSSNELDQIGAGGLSGEPLKDRSTEVIKFISQMTQGQLPIIGVGGIFTAQDALDKLNAGASLIQIYTGFIYKGPGLIKEIKSALLKSRS